MIQINDSYLLYTKPYFGDFDKTYLKNRICGNSLFFMSILEKSIKANLLDLIENKNKESECNLNKKEKDEIVSLLFCLIHDFIISTYKIYKENKTS